MFIDLTPLKQNAEYRKLFVGQTISFFGSMMTYVAVPFQAYEITKSSFHVGLISSIQLIPLLIAGLYGGALADSTERRKLLLWSEIGLFICTFGFIFNSMQSQPSYYLLILFAALSSALVGIHRPAMDAIVPQIVKKEHLTAVAALGSLRYSIGAVAGPALGGILISMYGTVMTYSIDALTFLISIIAIYKMKSVIVPFAENNVSIKSIIEGIKYAINTPVILGTYLVDIIAMVFAMPMALYPQLSNELNISSKLGWLYAAIPLGAATTSLFSKPFSHYKKHGAGVIIAATLWGVFIAAMAFSKNIYMIIFCLLLAGAADNVSAIYRSTIWNEVIPSNIRGRLGSLNMLSYMVGPLLGNVRAGSMASITNTHISILSGGILCTLICFGCIWIFPQFWKYRSDS